MSAIRAADVFLCGGGGILQDQTSIFNLPYFMKYAKLAQQLGKPVIYCGIGAGPLKYAYSRKLVCRVLNDARMILVRDNESAETLSDAGVCTDLIQVTADPALTLRSTPKEAVDAFLSNRGIEHGKILTVCLRNWFNTYPLIPVRIAEKLHLRTPTDVKKYRRFVTELAATLDDVANEFDRIVFLSFWHGRDDKVHRDVLSAMSNKSSAYILDETLTPGLAKGIIRDSALVLGMRLHSIVFSAAEHTPFVAIKYSKKLQDFLDMCMLSDQWQKVSIDVENVNGDLLSNMIRQAMESHTANHKKRAADIPYLIARAEKNVVIVNDLLDSLQKSLI